MPFNSFDFDNKKDDDNGKANDNPKSKRCRPRANHNLLERKRRKNLRDKVEELRNLLPNMNTKSSIHQIVSAAQEYIRILESQNSTLLNTLANNNIEIPLSLQPKSEIKFRKPQKSADKSAVDLMQATTPTAFNQSFATSPIQTSKNPVLQFYQNQATSPYQVTTSALPSTNTSPTFGLMSLEPSPMRLPEQGRYAMRMGLFRRPSLFDIDTRRESIFQNYEELTRTVDGSNK